jgi:hypothetical protein
MNYRHYISIIALLGIFTVSRAQQISFSSGSDINSTTIQAHVVIGQLFGSYQLSTPSSIQEGVFSILMNSTDLDAVVSLDNLIHIYPNPASAFLKIESDIFPWLVSRATVYSQQGNLIDSYLLADSKTHISIQQLPAGTYILRLSIPGHEDFTHKMLKVN